MACFLRKENLRNLNCDFIFVNARTMKRLDLVTLKQLRSLEAVVAHRSITGAAEALSLTPPAVHSQLKKLEISFGCTFLDRQGADGFLPTPEGDALLVAVHEVRSALARAVHQIDALKRGQSGSVILGVVSTAKYFAPDLVARLRRALPGINVILSVKNREGILGALTGRELDLAIMGRPPRVPAVHARVLGDHPHMLVAAPDHRLAELAAIAPEQLLDEHFIMREPGSGTRILCARYLDELGTGREVDSTEMGSNETIKQAVMSGLGIALLSGHTMVEELRTGRLVALRVPGIPIIRQWFLVNRIEVPLTGAVKTVSDWISGSSSEYLPRLEFGHVVSA